MQLKNLRTLLLAGSTLAAGYYLALAQPREAELATAADSPQSSTMQSWAPSMNLFGTMGKEGVLTPGRELTLFEQGGSGTLTHMWFGGSWPGWGNTRIRVYVDGERQAGIDMGLFMGHGIGWNDDTAPWGTNRIGKTGHPSGVYNTYKIPFGNGVKVTAELASEVHNPQTFWWIMRGVTNYAAYVDHIALPASARLRLHRKENFRAKPLQEVEILNTERNGCKRPVRPVLRRLVA